MKNKIAIFAIAFLFSAFAVADDQSYIEFQQITSTIPTPEMKVTCPTLSFNSFRVDHGLVIRGDGAQFGTASMFFGKNYHSGTYQCEISLSNLTNKGFKTIQVGSFEITLNKESDSAEFTSSRLSPITVQDGFMDYSNGYYHPVPITATPVGNKHLIQYTFYDAK